MIVLAEIDDLADFMGYATAAAELIPKFGGRYLVRGARTAVTLEGDWPEARKVVVSEWPSIEMAHRFWNSPEYAQIRQLRAGKARVSVRLVDGV